VLGAPVGGVNHVGFEEKRKHGREFDGEVCGKAARDASRTSPINEHVELTLQVAAGDGDPMRRDAALLIAVADAQGVLQNPLDARREMALAMVTNQGPAPTQQMPTGGLCRSLPLRAVCSGVAAPMKSA